MTHFAFIVLLLVFAALTGLLSGGRIMTKVVNLISAVTSLGMCYLGILGFTNNPFSITLNLFERESGVMGSLGSLTLKITPLSAFFLLILGVLSFSASLYGVSYMEMYKKDTRLYNVSYLLAVYDADPPYPEPPLVHNLLGTDDPLLPVPGGV